MPNRRWKWDSKLSSLKHEPMLWFSSGWHRHYIWVILYFVLSQRPCVIRAVSNSLRFDSWFRQTILCHVDGLYKYHGATGVSETLTKIKWKIKRLNLSTSLDSLLIDLAKSKISRQPSRRSGILRLWMNRRTGARSCASLSQETVAYSVNIADTSVWI